ncbi:MAG: type II toxin-antitoxin system PemK/MazF family toxin [Actinobacteria bacterium]|nr:type II toxin-antitoxin system PemK/MazF family toxin [Actinomycetota bacterium]
MTILPITSLKPGRKIYPNEVLIEKDENKNTGLSIDSIIMAHQIRTVFRTVSKNRLKRNIGSIDGMEIMEEVNEALRIHLNL